MRAFLLVCAAVVGCGESSEAPTDAAPDAPSSGVPAEFQELYGLLEANLAVFNATIDAEWDGSKPPVPFGAEVIPADAYTAIVQPGYYDASVTPFLDGLEAMGLPGIDIIDIHVHAANHRVSGRDFLAIALEMAKQARAHGKKVGFDEECSPAPARCSATSITTARRSARRRRRRCAAPTSGTWRPTAPWPTSSSRRRSRCPRPAATTAI